MPVLEQIPLVAKQRELVDRLLAKPAGPKFLIAGTGCGKTRMTAAVVLAEWERHGLLAPAEDDDLLTAKPPLALVVVPSIGILSHFKAELEKIGQKAHIIRKRSPHHKVGQVWADLDAALAGGARFLLVPYNILGHSLAPLLLDELGGRISHIIFDECQKLKGGQSTLYAGLWTNWTLENFTAQRGDDGKVKCGRILFASATPLVHSPSDVINLIKLALIWPEFRPFAAELRPVFDEVKDEFDGSTRRVPKYDEQGRVVKAWAETDYWTNAKGAKAKFADRMARGTKEEIFPSGRPPQIVQRALIDIGSEQALYEHIVKIMELGKLPAELREAWKAVLRSFIFADDAQPYEQQKEQREALCEGLAELLHWRSGRNVALVLFGHFQRAEEQLIAEGVADHIMQAARADGPIVVFTKGHASLDALAARAETEGLAYSTYTGKITSLEERERRRDLLADGSIQILFATKGAAKEGIEFPVKKMIIAQRDVSPGDDKQVCGRNDRMHYTGQRYVDILGAGIDGAPTRMEKALDAIVNRKREFAAEIGLAGTLG